nr:hypothetical protein [Tanacetum cinerariifolium]
MAELLRAPTEGYVEAIVVPPILAEHFELKHSLINMMNADQFFGLEKDNPHDHIRWFNKITSTIKYKDVPSSAIKLMLFPFSLAGAARQWLEKEPPCSIHTWEDLVSKFINEFFPSSRTTNLQTFYNALNPADQDSLNAAAGRNFVGKKPTVPTLPQSINPEVDERVEETFTDPDLAEYTIKVPPPPAQKYKPLSQREFVVHKRDPLYLNILYPSRMLKQK